jgi:hypothetical protein
MEYRPYDRIEQKILGSDTGAIRYRWEWGHLVLVEPELTQPDGRLKPGAIDKLIAKAAAKGSKLSRREVQHRVQLAKMYRYEAQIAHAGAHFGTWSDLRSAGFPALDVPSDEEPYDPRTPGKKRDDAERELDRLMDSPAAHGQDPIPGLEIYLPGFTPDTVGPETVFRDAWKIHETICEQVTGGLRQAAEKSARADRERWAKLSRMFNAVNRNPDATLAEGEAALKGQERE